MVSNIPGAMRRYLFCRDRIAWANNVLLARWSFFFFDLRLPFILLTTPTSSLQLLWHRRMSAGLKKRRKSMVFLGISIVICWIMFAKESEKSDELMHSISLSKLTTVPINSNGSTKKKERAKISKSGAWIISDNYEYLLDENLARQLVNLFRNNTVIEFGAGTGRYTSYLQNEGIDVRGYDGVKNISDLTNGLVQSLDLTKPVGINPSDWVLCLEVAEHIPRKYEYTFIENLQKSSRKGVVLSWAGISQPGVGHVNNREQKYVKNIMTRGGFTFVEESSKLLRDNSKLWWFKKNVMVFVRPLL